MRGLQNNSPKILNGFNFNGRYLESDSSNPSSPFSLDWAFTYYLVLFVPTLYPIGHLAYLPTNPAKRKSEFRLMFANSNLINYSVLSSSLYDQRVLSLNGTNLLQQSLAKPKIHFIRLISLIL